MATASTPRRTSVCIAGCGPAGAMLGFLLARAGIEVVVLEKHPDFLRDFRGDTVHPSTLEILDELGLADRFLELPHSRVPGVTFDVPGQQRVELSFKHLRTRFPFIAFVPQWDFLNFVTAEAARYPTFSLLMRTDADDLIIEDETVRGVRYRTDDGDQGEIRATLTVGADGRTSVTRAAAGLPLIETSPAMDVLWFRLSRRAGEPEMLDLRLMPGRFAALINRRDYWQIAWVIPKGEFDNVRASGLDAFRQAVSSTIPELANRVDELRDWDQIKLLTVRADRLARWYRAGYLAIGDAAHAMSPIAGVGINVAIQDAVEAANLLWRPLRTNTLRVRPETRPGPPRAERAADAGVPSRTPEPRGDANTSPHWDGRSSAPVPMDPPHASPARHPTSPDRLRHPPPTRAHTSAGRPTQRGGEPRRRGSYFLRRGGQTRRCGGSGKLRAQQRCGPS